MTLPRQEPDWVIRSDPRILSCSCTSKTLPCRHLRPLIEQMNERNDERARLAALTVDDRSWLQAHGWKP